jgi:hypothetical protein
VLPAGGRGRRHGRWSQFVPHEPDGFGHRRILANDLGYNESAIATLLGHKTHSITSRYVHSADAVLLAAADVVTSATMKLMEHPGQGASSALWRR